MGVEVVSDDLVRAAQDGDVPALNTLYRALAAAVHGYLCSKGVDDADAATSDVFLGLFAQLGRVRGGATGLRKLTFSIAHARMVDEYRTRQRRPTTLRWTAEDDTRREPWPSRTPRSTRAPGGSCGCSTGCRWANAKCSCCGSSAI